VIEIMDAPTWSTQNHKGKGDRIRVTASETRQFFKVIGKAWASLDLGDIRIQQTHEPQSEQKPIEISADQYEFDGTKLRFEGLVKASQGDAWTLSCKTLTADIDEKQKTAVMIEASEMVQMTQQDGDEDFIAKANKVVYEPVAPGQETVILTGNAQVDTEEFVARGERIEINKKEVSNTIHVSRGATLEFPDSTISSIGILNFGDNPSTRDPSKALNQVRITSKEYSLVDNKAVFTEKVSIQFQDETLNCDTLEVVFSPDRKWIKNIFATGTVHLVGKQGRMTCREINGMFSESTHQMDRLRAEGNVSMTHPRGKARGETAVFYPQTQMIELQGEPRIMTTLEGKSGRPPQYILAEGESLMWDQAKHRFNGPRGRYRIKTIKNPEVW
jgi:lipopolysaccharide transport protein LptA